MAPLTGGQERCTWLGPRGPWGPQLPTEEGQSCALFQSGPVCSWSQHTQIQLTLYQSTTTLACRHHIHNTCLSDCNLHMEPPPPHTHTHATGRYKHITREVDGGRRLLELSLERVWGSHNGALNLLVAFTHRERDSQLRRQAGWSTYQGHNVKRYGKGRHQGSQKGVLQLPKAQYEICVSKRS